MSEIEQEVEIMENENIEEMSSANNAGVIGSDGLMLPYNWLKMSYQERKIWANQGKPCISPIHYSILKKDGTRQFGRSTAKSNFNLADFEQEVVRAFPYAAEVQVYIDEDQWKIAQKY